MDRKIVILTGSELRHSFFRQYLASVPGIAVLRSFCESQKGNLQEVVARQKGRIDLRQKHLYLREQTERDFFEVFCSQIPDQSHPYFLEKGQINNPEYVEQIIALNPDVIIAYGCSIIRPPLIQAFTGRFINVHLGLSPYYRGSGTNFWPFVNGELSCVGVTYMHIDAGIDTGEILHQQRAVMVEEDHFHQINYRLIRDMAITAGRLVLRFDRLESVTMKGAEMKKERFYRKKDFTEESVEMLYHNIASGMINDYVKRQEQLDLQFPIIENPALV